MADRTFFSDLLVMVGIIAQRSTRWKIHIPEVDWALGYNPPQDPMSLISAQDLVKSYGAQDIFSGVSLSVPHQARIALVGPNGIGKTTLLRILAGVEKMDRGRLQRARDLHIGYLPQEAGVSTLDQIDMDQSLWESTLVAFAGLRSQEAELARLEREMGDPRLTEQALARYGPMQEAFERAGGYTYPARVRRVLRGLGFQPESYGQPLRTLSGGERTRALLARLLLKDPALLILDEPTNHLDIQAVEWLEGWLHAWPGAAIVVSHDRYFLDRTVDVVWELAPTGLESYRGDYTAYAAQRAERYRLHSATYRAQREHIEREQAYIRKNIAGQNTRQAQGRRKRLERMMKTEALAPVRRARKLNLDFGEIDRSGDHVLETQDLVIQQPESAEVLFRVPDLLLLRGECVALIGPNGAGKTTLLKTLIGEIKAAAGRVRLGAGLQLGYFEQAHAGLVEENSILEEIIAAEPSLSYRSARDFLGSFLFSGEDVEKPVAVLSGGERGRVALAKLALEGANFLLLDEPTNHLDLPSQEILQQTLEAFPGTVLLVTHDRYLIDALATQLWVISPGERSLAVFEGGYKAYLEGQREATAPRIERRIEASVRKGRPSVGRVDVEKIENRIQSLESELTRLGLALQDAGSDRERMRALGERYRLVERELESEFSRWEDIARSL
jgi:ATP-binding cassette subfamily F protein 3